MASPALTYLRDDCNVMMLTLAVASIHLQTPFGRALGRALGIADAHATATSEHSAVAGLPQAHRLLEVLGGERLLWQLGRHVAGRA